MPLTVIEPVLVVTEDPSDIQTPTVPSVPFAALPVMVMLPVLVAAMLEDDLR